MINNSKIAFSEAAGDEAQIRESNSSRWCSLLRVALVISFPNSRILDHRATTNRSKFSEMRRDANDTENR